MQICDPPPLAAYLEDSMIRCLFWASEVWAWEAKINNWLLGPWLCGHRMQVGASKHSYRLQFSHCVRRRRLRGDLKGLDFPEYAEGALCNHIFRDLAEAPVRKWTWAALHDDRGTAKRTKPESERGEKKGHSKENKLDLQTKISNWWTQRKSRLDDRKSRQCQT